MIEYKEIERTIEGGKELLWKEKHLNILLWNDWIFKSERWREYTIWK